MKLKDKRKIEELACEFFYADAADFRLGENGGSLWISTPERSHYLGAHDCARFYSFALDAIGQRALKINPDLLAELLY